MRSPKKSDLRRLLEQMSGRPQRQLTELEVRRMRKILDRVRP